MSQYIVCEAGSIHCKKKWPPKGFKLADFLKFLKLGLTEMTSASGRRPCVRAVYPSLVDTSLQVKQGPWAAIEVLVPVGHAAPRLAQLRVGVLHIVHKLRILL